MGIFFLNFLLATDPTASTVSLPIGNDKSSPGLAIYAGFGALYGGTVGISVEYQFALNPTLRLTPLFSVGSATGNDSLGTTLNAFGYCVGINLEFGTTQRFFIGPIFGTLLIDEGFDKDSIYIRNTVVGPTLIGGLKWITRFGFLWEISAGMGYQINNKVAPALNNRYTGLSAVLAPTLNIGFGYKF